LQRISEVVDSLDGRQVQTQRKRSKGAENRGTAKHREHSQDKAQRDAQGYAVGRHSLPRERLHNTLPIRAQAQGRTSPRSVIRSRMAPRNGRVARTCNIPVALFSIQGTRSFQTTDRGCGTPEAPR
jgi:hypothetical protein